MLPANCKRYLSYSSLTGIQRSQVKTSQFSSSDVHGLFFIWAIYNAYSDMCTKNKNEIMYMYLSENNMIFLVAPTKKNAIFNYIMPILMCVPK